MIQKANLSLKNFLSIGLFVVFFCASLTAVTLWYSTHSTNTAVDKLTESVESAGSTQVILQNLSIHRRQALLKGLHSNTERRQQTELAKTELVEASKDLENFSTTPGEEQAIQNVQNAISTYLKNYELLRAQGLRAEDLYVAVTEEYYTAEAAIQDLTKFNLDEASRLQTENSRQNKINYTLVFLTFMLLTMAIIILLWGLRKYFYQPIVKLKQTIESFELGQKIDFEETLASSEIEAIANSFKNLSEKLSKQKEMQLTFLSSIAHDLKNPLGAIKMSNELILDDPDLSKQSRELLSIITRQSDHMLRLISDLLDTTRIESGHMDLKFMPYDVRTLIQDSAVLHSNLSPIHKIEIEIPNSPVMVLCDEQRLMQVFNNLFNNAIKYSPRGGMIKSKIYFTGDHVKIDISDRGVGILPEDLNGIFEPFRRSTTTRDTIPGVGLGLSVAKKILCAHADGNISVTSKIGAGTTFCITLHAQSAPATFTQELG